MDMSTAESVLKETNRIMAELGVAYFLRHGTCLGAVRDGAFIPWDDDLDVGSVLGLHGLTEEIVDQTVDVFRENGFTATVVHNELNISVSMQKSGTQMDWTCYRIFGDVIYQWPVVKIPVALHEELKEIDFLGDSYAVVGNDGSPPLSLQHHVLALGTQSQPHRVGHSVDAMHEESLRFFIANYLFWGHCVSTSCNS